MLIEKKQIGRIIKGIGGFYYVKLQSQDLILECKARGLLRHQNIKPVVGDIVKIQSDNPGEWTIESIEPRKNLFVRPTVANVDIGLIVFSMTSPKPNLLLLDKLLISSEVENVEPIICFSKKDLAKAKEEERLREIYSKTPYKQFFFSDEDYDAMDEIANEISQKTAFMAGPSGVGKSTLANNLCENQLMETGELSLKLKRGKHTTRHVELLKMKNSGFLLDTPGFSSFNLSGQIQAEDLKNFFPEFLRKECRFTNCLHLGEPGCEVKKDLEAGKISEIRYEHYLYLLKELKKDNGR